MELLFFFTAGLGLAYAATISPKLTPEPTSSLKTVTTTSTACYEYTTTVVDFATLESYKDAGTVLGEYFFTSFYVQPDKDSGVKVSSGNKVALTPPFGAEIGKGSGPDDEIVIFLKSFYFACIDGFPHVYPVQEACDIKFIRITPSNTDRYREYGPFTYTPDYIQVNESTPQPPYEFYPMQKVTFSDDDMPWGTWFDFFMTDGPAFSQIVFDTFEFVHSMDFHTCSNL